MTEWNGSHGLHGEHRGPTASADLSFVFFAPSAVLDADFMLVRRLA